MEDSKDRLSLLHDDILIKIMSYLSIKTVVATSVLSRRWHRLWTHITAFRLDYERPKSWTDLDVTISIVNNVLPKLKSPVISTFVLQSIIYTHDTTSIKSWLRLLCHRNIQELCIRSRVDPVLLPTCLFKCQTLVSLSIRLKPSKSAQFPKKINLPNLKKLDVSLIPNSEDTLMGKLLKSCPRLEELFISCNFFCNNLRRIFDDKGEFPVFISGQYLKSLDIQFLFSDYDYHDQIVVYIDAPNLQIFKALDFNLFRLRFTNKPIGLLKAELQSFDEMGKCSSLADVFQVISGVSSLIINKVLLLTIFRNDYHIPIFNNLRKLVCPVSSISSWQGLLRLLECAAKLDFLDITLCCYISLNNNVLFPQDLLAPFCLVHRIKKMKIEIYGILDCQYQVLELELEAVKYLLRHAHALEELVIKVHCRGSKSRNELKLHEELDLYHLYDILRDFPMTLGLDNCSVTLKFVLYDGIIRLGFPHHMEYEDERSNGSSIPNLDLLLGPSITLKDSFST